ncbi:M28 family metallopeptidase [Echinicola vietnamensis]|uniref:Putative aminopeptidase n=1 Tax=Echinicola vietnamensis (strain DSM 17526 / LMG 23754 / KMM 6221) TaxID=926556 RepID=L0FZE5_ECHVK|nr:M20/M25/M40 family metallo-hydrolase [Echinicola vietnamensis]AGA78116.1 putative aminopeptidase [Echinicola vietnamensis DSM 17526]
MKRILINSIVCAILSSCLGCTVAAQVSDTNITEEEIGEHLAFLTSSKTKGRYPGTAGNRRVVKYIRTEFEHYGLKNFHGDYLQQFKAKLRRADEGKSAKEVKTWNVVGYIEGNDNHYKKEYVVIGAHYDHLGHGGPSSKKPESDEIHPGADDNASGVSALLEIAEKLARNRYMLDRSVIFVAFGAEEQGLLGSKYFVENLPVAKERVKLMINMDMIGRLNAEKQIYMGGAGTFPGGVELMTELGIQMGLNPVVHAGEVGGSDHVSFYKEGISAIGLHTGGHPEYHRPEDTMDLINISGEKTIAEYIYKVLLRVVNENYDLTFIPQD